jgi:sterol desaturase/sphingolipid hydroxylase (fatty acid hydroxylase superfamily)
MDAILICLSIPVFFGAMALEYGLGRWRGKALYRFTDSISNLGSGLGSQVWEPLFLPLTAGVYALVWSKLRFATQSPRSVVAWIVLLFGVDLAYYWFHRVSHRVNLLWAAHAVHHQSEEYNLSVALRQSWFGPLVSWPFYLPLALAGFPVGMYLAMHTLNTLYQFWIHTRLVGRMGPLEWFLNTPSHHRVHHGVNPQYIDKNYAGIFIIWDRLFGTFEPEREPVVYGLVKPLASFDPLWANLSVWVQMARMSRATRRLRDKLHAWLAPPEWRPVDLGGVVTVPEPGDRPKFDVPSTAKRDRWVALQLVAASGAMMYFLYGQATLPAAARVAVGAAILAVVIVWGRLYASAPSSDRAVTNAPEPSPTRAR